MKYLSTTFFIIASVLMLFSTKALFCESPHVRAAIELLTLETEFIKKEPGVIIFSLGGAFVESINKLALTVEVPKKLCPSDPELTIDPRRLFVILLKHFIDQTNVIEEIRPYLKNYPFTSENFDYRVIFPDFNTPSSIQYPKVALVYNRGNKIVYCYRDNVTKRLEPFFSETYEVALKTVLGIVKDKKI